MHAHPDDESSKGAGTLARYAADGAQVTVVSCTGGESGSVLNERFELGHRASRDITGVRRLEMAAAQAALGVEHVWLGYVDSDMPPEGEPLRPLSFATIPLEISGRPLVRLIRRLRPQVVVTYDETGGYPHPDHIRCHEVTMWAVEHAAAGLPELGEPWEVQKVYFDRTMSGARLRALLGALEASVPDDERLPFVREWVERMGDRGETMTTRVDVAAHLEARDIALRAHASQVDPESRFFFWPNELLRETWPTEDYELVRSRAAVDGTEDDLFAGVEEE
ncbi:mycothiol conjugate amidase Mca [Agrococcus baldri]|uniref:mycothiol conjugate amidase Mca n=1 Tax=Agrococcus baldri TaxID=153730 RepID=UPI00296F71C1|nr:mycothiol conjugate amidase Mca [Agrococcus baldri]